MSDVETGVEIWRTNIYTKRGKEKYTGSYSRSLFLQNIVQKRGELRWSQNHPGFFSEKSPCNRLGHGREKNLYFFITQDFQTNNEFP